MPLSTTIRSTPNGTMLKDGFSTKIAFAADTDVEFWEKTVQPPGFDGGDAIDVTTMHNSTVRTMAARALYSRTEASFTAAYDPAVFDSIRALINVETSITIHFPDGSTESMFGYLKAFEPNALEEGSHPEASVTIAPTNRDPSDDTENAGNYNTGTGTS